jgi:uroporphyrinogen decarboxylase
MGRFLSGEQVYRRSRKISTPHRISTIDRMSSINFERFWSDNAIGLADPFGKDIPQVPMGVVIGQHCMFAEIGLKEDMRRLEEDYEWSVACSKAFNDRAEQIVGKRFLDETLYDPSKRFPHVKELGELFGCERIWESESWWLLEAAHDRDELKRLLDRVEKLDFEAEMFPDNWHEECRCIFEQHGIKPVIGHGLRGPVTLATSIFGAENLIYLIHDDPPLAERFRDVLCDAIIRYHTIADRYSDPKLVKGGFSFRDDNCALLTPDMYALFGQPILQRVFDTFAPGPAPDDQRYQHSDSDMGHLMPLLNETGMWRVNFGPTVRFADIHAAMPRAIVHGTFSPMTMMRNETEQLAFEVKRDLDEARETRGLIVDSAGSVNDGSLLTSLRVIMETIVEHGRYN